VISDGFSFAVTLSPGAAASSGAGCRPPPLARASAGRRHDEEFDGGAVALNPLSC